MFSISIVFISMFSHSHSKPITFVRTLAWHACHLPVEYDAGQLRALHQAGQYAAVRQVDISEHQAGEGGEGEAN
jgi:hypothetical protein